jgi:hypothetical protein
VSGRIDPPGDQDVFQISLRKGDKRLLRVESRALGRPLDPVLRVLNSVGKALAESDDAGENSRDVELSFTAPADGEYRVMIRDLYGQGGFRFAYLFSVREPQPDFALTLAADRFELSPGKPTKITVEIGRKNSFAEPIEIVAEGLPAGVTAKPMTSKAGDASAKSVMLELSGAESAKSGAFHIGGRITTSPGTRHIATTAIAGFDARTTCAWVTVHNGAKAKGK